MPHAAREQQRAWGHALSELLSLQYILPGRQARDAPRLIFPAAHIHYYRRYVTEASHWPRVFMGALPGHNI